MIRSWIKQVSDIFHEKWQYWFIHGEKTKTRFDNIRSPGYTQVINWVSETWVNFNKTIIRESFDYCGITQYDRAYFHKQLQSFLQDGSLDMVADVEPEDELTHCFADDVDALEATDDDYVLYDL